MGKLAILGENLGVKASLCYIRISGRTGRVLTRLTCIIGSVRHLEVVGSDCDLLLQLTHIIPNSDISKSDISSNLFNIKENTLNPLPPFFII